MTEKRKRYEESYNPVFEYPEIDNTGAEETIVVERSRSNQPVKDISRGKKVKPGRRREDKPGADTAGKSSSGRGTVGKTKSADLPGAGFIEKFVAAVSSETFRWICGLILCAFGAYLAVSFVSYFSHCIADQAQISNSVLGSLPDVGNSGGEGGARLAEFFINESFGLGSFVIILWLLAMGLKLLFNRPKFKSVNFTIKCIVGLITLSLIIGLLTLSFDSPVNWGGYHGRYVNEFIVKFFGMTGGWILCFLLIAIFIVICLRDLINWILRKRAMLLEKRRIAAEAKAERLRKEQEIEEMRLREEADLIKAGEAATEAAEDSEDDNIMKFNGMEGDLDSTVSSYSLEEDSGRSNGGFISQENSVAYREDTPADGIETGYAIENDETLVPAQAHHEGESESEVQEFIDENIGKESDKYTEESESHVTETDTPAEPSAEEGSTPKMIVNVNQIAKADTTDNKESFIKRMYKFPSPMLLREGEQKLTVDIEEQQANKERIRETLLYHGIPIVDIKATVGPTVTLYEIRPEQGVKISKIKNLADDIALSLSAIGVRIIAPIPGKGTVGIEVANADPQTVSMRTIIQSRKYNETRFRLPIALGSTIGNDVYIADLTKMPHLLVAGATGQGKSVGLNAIITSILYKKRPDEVKFVMIDPKEVEFSLYAKLESHYLAKIEGEDAIVTDMNKVVGTLNSLCIEMDNRYKLLRNAEVRNIEEYNYKISQNKLRESDGHRFMPYIVLIVDEFADLIMTSGKEVETPIARLAQKARAIGIHVIIATQRPSTNVITGIIKANFPVRIAFKVSSGIDSKTILDTTGAQSLIGKGDMLIGNNSDLVRVQCAFVDTPEVEEICSYISKQPFNSGPYILPEPQLPVDGEGPGNGSSVGGDIDPLFEEVGSLVVTSGMGSTSGVQRRFSIGYARAGKIMDQLEYYGIVGPSVGSKPRSVLVDDFGFRQIVDNLRQNGKL